jgi:hypothetical protein
MVSFLDLILFRRLTKSTPMVLASLGITLFCLIPAMPLLGRYYLKLLPYYLKIGGFWQPHWALPSEIVGFSDIYRNFLGWYGPDFVPKLISRTWTVFVFNLSLSIAIVGFFFTQIFRRKGIDRSFWLAAPVFVLLTFLTCFFEGHHNYPYMKSYTLFMPLLFCAFYDGFHHTGMTGSALLSRLLSCSKYIVILMIVLVGLFHVQEYSRTSSVVNEDMYELQELFRKVDLSNKVFLPRDKLIGATSPDQRHQIWQQWLLEMMILPLFPVSKIDEQRLQDQNFQPHLSKEVYLILKKQDLPCYPCTAQKNVGHIVWENGTFLIVATGKTLREGFSSNSGGKIDLKVFWSVI